MDVSGVIICQNEEELIERAVQQLSWTDEIIVIDGGSNDRTVEILQGIRDKNTHPPMRILRNKFNGHFGDQKNFGIALAKCSWVFVLDADEVLESGLVSEIKSVMNERKFDGIAIPRKNFINGVMTKHYPDYQYRCFRSFCRYIYPVHEELVGARNIYMSKHHIIHNKTLQRYNSQQSNYKDIINRMTNKFRRSYEEW